MSSISGGCKHAPFILKMGREDIQVTKASGLSVPFNKGKLKQSLLRAGASAAKADEIVTDVMEILVEGMSTKKIYKMAFKLLRNVSRPTAARYKLKQALLELGPTGYPFELFIAELLKHRGYAVKVGEIVQGHCITHEIDVIAVKKQEYFIIECKFHNRQGYIGDVKIPLYIQSRFLDIEKQWKQKDGHENKSHQGWVVTNTRFSGDAMHYATCMGLHLVGWDYPLHDGLRDWIDRSGLYPVTSLTTLTQYEKQQLLNDKIVLCKEVHQHPALLESIGVKQPRLQKALEECRVLCETKDL